MTTRIKITVLFTIITLVLLSVLCGYIYYSFSAVRKDSIRAQLMNRALTTARLLSQPDVYNDTVISEIDAAPQASVKNKSVQAYDNSGRQIFIYTDDESDTVRVTSNLMEEARLKGSVFFSDGEKRDAVIYHDEKYRLSVVAAGYDEAGYNNLSRVKMILWLGLAGGILAAIISGYFFSGLLLQPVKRIADEVNHISAQSLGYRIETGSTDDEWNHLTKILNDLLDRLQQDFQIQRRFIASASHELSTPLTAISSQLEVMLQKDRTTDEYKKVIRSVDGDVQQLKKLTQTLLELSAISSDSGGMELKPVRIDEVLMMLPSVIKKADHRSVVKFNFDNLPRDEDKLVVFGNEQLLFSAIKNIVYNACKYSPDHTAKVKLCVEAGQIVVLVEDEGKGMSATELENIFKPFYRAADSKPTDGFGVGLTLVNRIIKLHRGQIRVDSIVGQGTTFRVQLPVAARGPLPA